MTRAAATHCRNGHLRTPENVGRRKDPRWPVCLVCKREGDAYRRAAALRPCGTTAAYQRHKAHGEKPCAKCKAAYVEAKHAGTEAEGRVEGRIALGWPAARIMSELGVTREQVAAAWRRINRAHKGEAS